MGVPSSSTPAPFGFQGMQWDSMLGLYYDNARLYNPTLGRFLSQDPLGYAANANGNLYDFVGNDPTGYSDPSGMDPNAVVQGAGGGSGGVAINVGPNASVKSLSPSLIAPMLPSPPGGDPTAGIFNLLGPSMPPFSFAGKFSSQFFKTFIDEAHQNALSIKQATKLITENSYYKALKVSSGIGGVGFIIAEQLAGLEAGGFQVLSAGTNIAQSLIDGKPSQAAKQAGAYALSAGVNSSVIQSKVLPEKIGSDIYSAITGDPSPPVGPWTAFYNLATQLAEHLDPLLAEQGADSAPLIETFLSFLVPVAGSIKIGPKPPPGVNSAAKIRPPAIPEPIPAGKPTTPVIEPVPAGKTTTPPAKPTGGPEWDIPSKPNGSSNAPVSIASGSPCFTAGTPLLTPSGGKLIEDFRPGDFVLSRDDHDPDSPVMPKVVEEVFRRAGEVLVLRIGVVRGFKEGHFRGLRRASESCRAKWSKSVGVPRRDSLIERWASRGRGEPDTICLSASQSSLHPPRDPTTPSPAGHRPDNPPTPRSRCW